MSILNFVLNNILEKYLIAQAISSIFFNLVMGLAHGKIRQCRKPLLSSALYIYIFLQIFPYKPANSTLEVYKLTLTIYTLFM